jgi:hypothetical protein
VFTSPAHRSPVTRRTPVSPREMSEETKLFQLAESSFMPSVTPITSRCPSDPTPIATSTLTFSTAPPQLRLCQTPSMNTYGYGWDSGRCRHWSICAYTRLSWSDRVCDGIRSPHRAWLMSSTRLVDTPARYMSIRASSTDSSRLR